MNRLPLTCMDGCSSQKVFKEEFKQIVDEHCSSTICLHSLNDRNLV